MSQKSHELLERPPAALLPKTSESVEPTVVARKQDATSSAKTSARPSGAGLPIDTNARSHLEHGFGQDLSAVRVHDDAAANKSAARLGAQAYTAGRDIYFGAGRYQPETQAGRHLLAHEVTHSLQQGSEPQHISPRLVAGPSDHPAEREADQAADQVVKGGSAGPIKRHDVIPGYAQRVEDEPGSSGFVSEPVPERDPAKPTSPAVTPPPATTPESGGVNIKLGSGIALSADDLGEGRRVKLDLSQRPIAVPGLRLKELSYNITRKTGTIKADLAVPMTQPPRGGITINIAKSGSTSIKGNVEVPLRIGALNNPKLRLSLDDSQQLSASVSVTGASLKPRGVRNLKIEASGEVGIQAGKPSGSVSARLEYPGLGKGNFDFAFKDGVPKSSGEVEITQPHLAGVKAALGVEEGNLTTDVTIPASKIAPPIPGLSVPAGSLQLIMRNSDLSGNITGLTLAYKELGQATLNGGIRKGVAHGEGTFTLTIPALEAISGTVGYSRAGKLYGSAVVKANHFPAALPIKSGSIKAGIDEHANPNFAGKLKLEFAGVGSGEVRGAYDQGKLGLGADVALDIPGLQGFTGRVDYINGELEGDMDIPIASDKLAGLGGTLHVEYRNKLWKGEQTIAYSADNGKLSGSIKLGVMQQEKGNLVVYGGGDVTAQLTSFLAGTLQLNILPEGTTKIAGAITVTEPIQLFPEKRTERELVNIQRNIPLWAILVAVIRFRAGVRAGIGPGQLRDITVEGEYTIGEESPSFRISGELFIPAFAEGYIAFGAGLGLDVVLGSLTGGLEAVGTAGLYGAISVIPELAYNNGDYTIEGTATMAAGARIKLGLQAWAEIEALWFTVWEQTWQLAEKTFNVGPTLALQAKVKHRLGDNTPPEFTMDSSNIDGDALVKQAMPKDGPGGSGARDALKNRAKWSGRNKGKGKDGDKVPEEATKNQKKGDTPKTPAKPPKKQKSADGKIPKGPVKEKGGKVKPGLKKVVDDAAKKTPKDKTKGVVSEPPKIPTFPVANPGEKSFLWDNWVLLNTGSVMTRGQFERRIDKGFTYHPKISNWRSLKQDYKQAYAFIPETDKQPAKFAARVRKGEMGGSTLTPNGSNSNPPPAPTGSSTKPYPVRVPKLFLLSALESFNVTNGGTVPPTPRIPHNFIDPLAGPYAQTFGIEPKFPGEYALNKKFKRVASSRGSKQRTEANRWMKAGFTGGASIGAAAMPTFGGETPEFNFGSHQDPYTGDDLGHVTFKRAIEDTSSGMQGYNNKYSHYHAIATIADRNRVRQKAGQGVLNISDRYGHVNKYMKYLNSLTKRKGFRGTGYEMQHVLPLFMNPVSMQAGRDVPANLWPMEAAQHSTGHNILKSQPHLAKFGGPTNIEQAPVSDYFIVDSHA